MGKIMIIDLKIYGFFVLIVIHKQILMPEKIKGSHLVARILVSNTNNGSSTLSFPASANSFMAKSICKSIVE